MPANVAGTILRPDTEDFSNLFCAEVPLMDVRAPVEFSRGAVPGAINLPLLDDAQRETIGIEYARLGQQAAIELGDKSATDAIRQHRITAWRAFACEHPDAYLYCFRGGLRSRITRQWLAENGIEMPIVIGGYKAMRNWLLNRLEALCSDGNVYVVSATTGSGKTDLLHKWSNSVDLEGLALHRGSAFGGTFHPQPSQASWENAVAVQWHRLSKNSDQPVLFEAESHLIGRISLPHCLQQALAEAPLLALETPHRERVERIRNDYVSFSLQHFSKADPVHAMQRLHDYAAGNLARIRKRLGGERYQRLMALLPKAVEEISIGGESPALDKMIDVMLIEYYDPLYKHKLAERQSRIVASGSQAVLLQWLRQN